MELLDYSKKLNTHEEYLKVLGKLEERCKYIEIVILDERESNELIDKFKNRILLRKKVTSWWGQEVHYGDNLEKNNRGNWLYQIKPSKEFFDYLRKYETFCKYYEIYDEEYNDYVGVQEGTDFGIDDIAFFDDDDVPLFFTTTHECYIAIRKDLEKELR